MRCRSTVCAIPQGDRDETLDALRAQWLPCMVWPIACKEKGDSVNTEHHVMPAESEGPTLTRRNLLQGTGAVIAASVLPAGAARAESPAAAPAPVKAASGASIDLTGELARYMVAARQQNLPPKVMLDGKHRILDALAAIVSGSRLRPGEMAIRFIRAQGGVPEASVLGTDFKTSAINAALANGMFAHADETDDVDPLTKAHPGAGVVPAAMAMAEKEQGSGLELLRAVVLGVHAVPFLFYGRLATPYSAWRLRREITCADCFPICAHSTGRGVGRPRLFLCRLRRVTRHARNWRLRRWKSGGAGR